ncbi:hypothetical protein ACH4FX_25985 [Streptomyces sp. NPDC018019]|uniref:hypothetical protein n=1 Tax=Streptomyces sp. NPDC018019 TaxID=3365030 RepID=UPI0037AD7C35
MTTVSPPPPLPDPPDGFAREIQELVDATAPRVFAVVEEYAVGGLRDAQVAAWGLAYEDGSADVAAVGGGFRMSVTAPDRAARFVSLRPGSLGSVVWPGT